MIAPLFFLLLAGLIDGALVFRSYLAMSSGVRDAARAITTDGVNALADYDGLQAIAVAQNRAGGAQVQKIVVYKANGFGDSGPPSACLTSITGETGLCNVYQVADLQRPSSDFGVGGWAQDDAWSAVTDRHDSNHNDDFVGVYVEFRAYQPIGAIGFGSNLSRNVVMRIEPSQS